MTTVASPLTSTPNPAATAIGSLPEITPSTGLGGPEITRSGRSSCRSWGVPARARTSPPLDLDDHRLVSGTDLHPHRRVIGAMICQQRLDRDDQPAAAEVLLARRSGNPLPTPDREGLDRRPERVAVLGQPEHRSRHRRTRLLAPHHTGLLQVTQPIGQQVRGHAGQPVAQIGVTDAVRSHQQLPHDQQAPAVSDHVEGKSQAAQLAVRTRHRSPSFPSSQVDTDT